MPFVSHLNFFYLYFKRHIEETHNVRCERADSKILTVPFLDKIVEYIKQADVLIADCSGRNPNVFYELGMAHALGKKVILITGDDLKDAPADVRHFDFIKYDLSDALQPSIDRKNCTISALPNLLC
jgi:nucleoside 2-deoxyribosyltransferase